MSWVRSNYRFHPRAALLSLPRELGFVPEPASVEAEVLDLIRHHRPDLAGGVLLGINFNFEFGAWEFLYAHDSFHRVEPGNVYERFPLIPLVPSRDSDCRPLLVWE